MSHEDMRWWVSYLATSGTTMWCDHCGMLHVSQLPAMATLLNMVPFCLMLSLAMHKWLRFTNIIISYDLFLRISLSALIQRLRLSEAAWYSWSLIDREITVYQSLSTCYCPWYSLKYCFVVKLNKIDVGKLWITSYANMLCCATPGWFASHCLSYYMLFCRPQQSQIVGLCFRQPFPTHVWWLSRVSEALLWREALPT